MNVDEIIAAAAAERGITLNYEISSSNEQEATEESNELEEILNNDAVNSDVEITSFEEAEDIEEEDEVVPEDQFQENSESITISDVTSRFKGASWYDIVQQQTIILAGVGGIGSYVGFLLSRMHPRALFIYDADKVESANMSGQLYSMSDVGSYKVTSLHSMCNNYSNYHDIFSSTEFFTEESEASNIMICGFDSMKSRRTFFDSWVKHVNTKSNEEKKECLFIDGRLSAESLQVYCVIGNDTNSIKKYYESLFDDSEADAVVCSYKQTSYCAAMIGAFINNIFVNFCHNLSNPFIERDVPFFTSYEADMMYFKTTNI